MQQNSKSWLMLLGVALLSSLMTLGLYKLVGFDRRNVFLQEGADNQKNITQLARKGFEGGTPDFVQVAEKTTAGVVHIMATFGGNNGASRKQEQGGRGNMPDLFKEFFGEGEDFFNPRQRGGKSQGSGSGVIISKDGYIVTNNHVVGDATEIEVILQDKRTYKAEIVGTAPATDLAVIKIKETNLPIVAFGNSDNVRVGEWVVAVGNPFNLESTVTAGIVSAKGRNLDILRQKDKAPIESFIQTDAAVNPGNSGGALVNTKGELIGINTAIASPNGSYAGYSFAVPSNIVKKIVKDLIEYGTVQRGYLGAQIRQLDGNLAKEKGIKNITEGVYIESLQPNSAAKDGGMQSGDIVIGIDGRKIKSSPELLEEIARKRPGDKLAILINRNGTEKTLQVTLKNENGNQELSAKSNNSDNLLQKLGLELAEITTADKQAVNVDNGVKVVKILNGKVQKQTEMRENFVITKVGGNPVKNVEDFIQKVKNIKGGVFVSGFYAGEEEEYYYAFGK